MTNPPRALPALKALTAAIAICIGTAGPASAGPTAAEDPRAVMVGGEAHNGAMLGGHFTLTRIVLGPAGQLLAEGVFAGTLTGPPGSVQTRFSQPLTLPVDRGASTSTCYLLNLYVGPGDVDMSGVSTRVDRADFIVPLHKGPGSRLLMPLCAVADLLPRDDTVGLRDALNQVLALLATVEPGT